MDCYSNVVNMRTELMLAVKERLDSEGIEIAFPRISVYAGEASKPIKVSTIIKEA
jgi:small-conductance mechanosensitive channel